MAGNERLMKAMGDALAAAESFTPEDRDRIIAMVEGTAHARARDEGPDRLLDPIESARSLAGKILSRISSIVVTNRDSSRGLATVRRAADGIEAALAEAAVEGKHLRDWAGERQELLDDERLVHVRQCEDYLKMINAAKRGLVAAMPHLPMHPERDYELAELVIAAAMTLNTYRSAAEKVEPSGTVHRLNSANGLINTVAERLAGRVGLAGKELGLLAAAEAVITYLGEAEATSEEAGRLALEALVNHYPNQPHPTDPVDRVGKLAKYLGQDVDNERREASRLRARWTRQQDEERRLRGELEKERDLRLKAAMAAAKYEDEMTAAAEIISDQTPDSSEPAAGFHRAQRWLFRYHRWLEERTTPKGLPGSPWKCSLMIRQEPVKRCVRPDKHELHDTHHMQPRGSEDVCTAPDWRCPVVKNAGRGNRVRACLRRDAHGFSDAHEFEEVT